MQAVALTTRMLVTGSLAGLAACAGASHSPGESAPKADYLGATATRLADDLVSIKLSIRTSGGREAIDQYAACVASAYAMKNHAGFVRHVRTLTDKEGGVWRADAVYSVSAALPKGVQTIDAEVTLADCQDAGIPTDEKPGHKGPDRGQTTNG